MLTSVGVYMSFAAMIYTFTGHIWGGVISWEDLDRFGHELSNHRVPMSNG